MMVFTCRLPVKCLQLLQKVIVPQCILSILLNMPGRAIKTVIAASGMCTAADTTSSSPWQKINFIRLDEETRWAKGNTS